MSCDNAGVALPANSASVSLVLINLCAARSLSPASACELAGVEGFEPPYGGIKTRCLTTWRHPSTLARTETSAGAHLTAASGPLPAQPQLLVHRRSVKSACDEAHPAVGHARRQAFGIRRVRARREDARAGAGQSRAALTGEPVERFRYLGRAGAHHRFAVVTPTRLKKGAYCDERGISCQFRALEHFTGADPDPGINDDVPRHRQLERGQSFPDSLRPGRRTSNKNRYIRAERHCQVSELIEAQTAVPQLIQCEERGRRIGAPPAEATALGDALVHAQVRAEAGARHLLQRERCAE